jgi:hypothetical protein
MLIIEDRVLTAKSLAELFQPVVDSEITGYADEAYELIKTGRFHMGLFDARLPTRSNPSDLLEHTRDLLCKLVVENDPMTRVACSREDNQKLLDWGCEFAVNFVGIDGKHDISGFYRSVCKLLQIPTIEVPPNTPLA